MRRTSDLTRSANGRTLDFAGRRGTSEGSQTLRKNRKSMKNGDKTLRQCFANAPCRKNSLLALPDTTERRFWLLRRAPGRSWASSLASRAALGNPPDALGARQGRSETLFRCSQDAFGTLWSATGRPGSLPASNLTRFWVPRGPPRQRFSIGFRIDFRNIAQLTIGPGRFGQVSSFLAALGSPTIRLAKKTNNLSTSLHCKNCNDLLASSGPCLVSSIIIL